MKKMKRIEIAQYIAFLLLRRVWNCGENGRQDSKMGLAHRTISI